MEILSILLRRVKSSLLFILLSFYSFEGSSAECALTIEGNHINIFICPGYSTTFEPVISGGTGAYTYLWSPSSGLSNPDIANPICHLPGNYTLTVTDKSGCKSTAIFSVFAHEIISINAGPDVTICKGDTVEIGRYYYVEGYANVSWTPISGVDFTRPGYPAIIPSETTTYIIRGTHENGCTSSDTLRVSVNSRPNINVPPSGFDAGRSNEFKIEGITINEGRPPYYYNWESVSGEWRSSGPGKFSLSPTIPIEKSSLYVLQVRDDNGCISEKTISVNAK